MCDCVVVCRPEQNSSISPLFPTCSPHFYAFHEFNGLYLLKLISIILFMKPCWTCDVWLNSFGCFFQKHTQNSPEGPANTEKKLAIFGQLLMSFLNPMDCICWNSSVSVFCGSIQAIKHVAELIWTLLLFQTHNSSVVLAVSTHKAWQISDSFWTLPCIW